MKPLLKLSVREIRGRPLRSLLTLLSIVIGVAAVVATSLASSSARLAQTAMVKAVTGRTALEIQSVGGDSFDGKPLEKIGQTDGVEIASPAIRRYASMTIVVPNADTPEAQKRRNTRYRIQLLGVDLDLDKQVRNYSLVAGANLTKDAKDSDHVLMDAGFAQSAKIAVNDKILFSTKGGLQTATVVGLIKANDASSALSSGLVVAQLRMVQKWCRASGKLDLVQIVLKEGAKVDEVKETIASQLPDGLTVRQPTLRSQLAGESTLGMEMGFRLAILFALLIATFVIYNTFQMNVGERRRQLGILRSLGATRGQLLWMIVREGLWLGLIGSAIGVVVGYFGATIFCKAISELQQIDIPQSSWSIWPYLMAITCGLLVAFFGALFPAMRASRMSPAEAMRVVSKGEFASSWIFWLIIGGTIVSIGVTMQLLAILGQVDVGNAVTGSVVIVVGIVFLLPACIDRLTKWVLFLLGFFLRTEGKLARRQILRHRGRSALTIGIVFMAMGLGLSMASTILDHIQDVEDWNRQAVVGDFFIRAAMPDMNSGQSADMPDGLMEKVNDMPGVELVDSLRFVMARSNETSVIVVVRKFNSNSQDYFALTEGEGIEVVKRVRQGQVVLGSVLSQRLNLHIGDQIQLETKEGASSLQIAGVTNEYIAGGLTLYMESENAKRLLNVDGTDVIVVKAQPGRIGDVDTSLRAMCDEYGLMFQSSADLTTVIRKILNNVVGGLWVVLLIGAVIAAFGLINTLAMNILEQTREIGMLRVVAMTRWQIRKMILAQALIMGLIGIVPGVLISMWISYTINLATMPTTGHNVAFQIHPQLMLIATLIELVIIVFASLLAAERAARINVSSALQYE